MSINPSFLSQYHSFKLCLGCWHPAVCFQAQPTSPGAETAEALLPSFTFMPQLLFRVCSGPRSQPTSLLEVMRVSGGSGAKTALTGKMEVS